MRIVTLNTWKNEGDYVRRLELMSSGLAALGADVVCLQECFAGAGRDTAARLADALGMTPYARPARAKARLHEGSAVVSTSGLAVLTGLPQIAEAACALSSDPSDGERLAQRIDLTCDGAAVRVLNLHLTHHRGEAAQQMRARQLREALDWARRDLTGGLVVAGDLNAGIERPELAPLRRAARGPIGPTLHGARVAEADPRRPAIDHCLLVGEVGWKAKCSFLALDEEDLQGRFPSDHAAVVLDLERRPSN